MQYCPNCMIQIRGRKARCPLCQRELMDPDSWTEPEPQRHPIEKNPEAVSAAAGDDEKKPDPNLTLQDLPMMMIPLSGSPVQKSVLC